MEPERWRRIKEVFTTVLAVPPAMREAWLAETLPADPRLADEVRELIADFEEGGEIFEVKTLAMAPDLPREREPAVAGLRIGPYRILSELGRGGMGAVYLAVRDDQAYEQRVAVKLVKRGMDTDDIVRRFVHERKILAALAHPNIARLIDGGSTSDGRPYFVMEYVAGRPASFNLPAAGPQERFTELWAIRELQQAGTEYLNIVVVGTIADDGSPTEGYAAKTGPNLGLLLAERVIGDGFGGSGTEGFADVQEIGDPTSYANVGNLAVTGYATVNGSQDVILLALSAGTLAPVAGTGYLFGDHAGGEERGTALAQVQASSALSRYSGFYINGFIRFNPLQAGDPEDMYLIKTDATGQTYCSLAWSPGDVTDDHDTCECDPHDEDAGTSGDPVSSEMDHPSWGSPICQ